LLVSALYPPGGLPGVPQDHPFEHVAVRPYWQGWFGQDQDENFRRISGGGAPVYVRLYVWNRSHSPHGVAARISIKATLHFGGPPDNLHHPCTLTRTAELPLCESSTILGLELFNVGGLTNWVVIVDEMTYYDLMGRERRGGWGFAVLFHSAAATIVLPKLFQPRKGEYTDEV
jgi:hypothetical protein